MKLPLSDDTTRDVEGVAYGCQPPQFAAKYTTRAYERVRRVILSQIANWLEAIASAWTGAEIAAYIRRLE